MNTVQKVSSVIAIALIFVLMCACFEIGQQRVDNWERKNDRIGEGLR